MIRVNAMSDIKIKSKVKKRGYDLESRPENKSRRREHVQEEEWILDFIKRAPFGYFATRWDDQPFVHPMTFWYDADKHCLYMHGAMIGRRDANTKRHEKIAFCASEMGRLLPSNRALNFSVQFKSVMAFGDVIEPPEKVNAAGVVIPNFYRSEPANARSEDGKTRNALSYYSPHADKVFSLFEPYTAWLCKGKAGVPVELGLNVCVMESTSGFILHHKVMQDCTDSEVAVDIVKETQARFPKLSACSFDKGFHSPTNQKTLAELLDQVVMPRKGKLSTAQREAENAPEFVNARRQHSAVESGINALEVHGLDRCPDRGLEHFKRYVALAVVGRNLQKLGAILQAKALKKLQRQEPRQRAA